MDRIEKPAKGVKYYADEAEIAERDRSLPPTATGREPGTEGEIETTFDAEVREKSPSARPRSAVTNVARSGTDEEAGDDGLTELEESVRHAAEDTPTGFDPDADLDAVPVFDRASLPPKI